MLDPNFKINIKDKGDYSAEVIIEPLPQNFGHTVGNALRRVLLTSLVGGAAIRVKIDGVTHQFSTVDGVKEDVLEFILNLKTLNFIVPDNEIYEAKIKVSGEKVVTAADIDLPAGVEVANPDVVLFNSTSAKSKFGASITITSGMGYVAADEHATNEIGVIPLDASFSPVLRANYTVESARVGRSSNYDKVRLTLTTDGTMTPEAAVRNSAEILSKFFSFVNSEEAHTQVEKVKATRETAGFIDDLDLPTRVLNALKKSGLAKLSDLKSLSLADLKKVKNLGEKSALQVVDMAKEKGIIIE